MRVLVDPFARPSVALGHVAVLVWVLASAVSAPAQAHDDGLFVTVPSPITTNQCQRDHGSRSIRAGIDVSTVRSSASTAALCAISLPPPA